MKKSHLLLLLLIFTSRLSFGQLAAEKLIFGQWDLVKIKVQFDDCQRKPSPCIVTTFFEVDSTVKKMRIKFYEKYAIMSYGLKTQQCTYDFNDTIVDPYFKNLGEVENDFLYRIEFHNRYTLLEFSYKKNELKLSKFLYTIDHIDNTNLIISTNSYDYGFNSKTTYFYTKSIIKKDSTKLSENDLYGNWFNYNGTKNDHCKEFHLDTFLITNKNILPSNTYFGCCLNFQFEHKFQPNEYNNLEISTLENEATEKGDGFIGIGSGDYYNWKLDYENQILYFYTISFNDNHERTETITVKLKLNYLGDGVLQCIRLPMN